MRIVISLVVLAAMLAGAAYGVVTVQRGAREAARAASVAQAYCMALLRKQYAQAYALLSPTAQSRTTGAIFTQTAQLHDAIDGPITRCVVPQPGLGAGFSFGSGSTRDTLNIQLLRGKRLSGALQLVKVAGNWRVDGVSASLSGTDVGPLLVEEQFCAALEKDDYATAEQEMSSELRTQLPSARLGPTFGATDFTSLSGCGPDLTTYQLSADDDSAQVRVPLMVTPQAVAQLLIVPVALSMRRQSTWTISGVQLAIPNLPPVTSVAPFGTPHLPAVAPGAPALSAAAAMLVNPATNEVYLGQNVDAERAMASTTKIMTAVVALTVGQVNQSITVTEEVAALDNGIDTVAGLRPGDVVTLRDLLYGLLLPSGDDAAVAIADGIAGSQTAYVTLMNMEASLLGLRETHYSDVHGLDAADHFTSVRDLLTLTEYAMRYPTFRQIVGTGTWQLGPTAQHQGHCWTSTNQLLPDLNPCPGTPANPGYPGATGVKTGFTGNAGGCLVFSAQRGNHQLLGVVLGEPSGQNDQARFADAAALLTWGFSLEQRGL
jgi:serine-type D-Ala-D-Ala carboxypeptidase (penicillin-binding protein 5/6)